MSASLVGSEMCIRDRGRPAHPIALQGVRQGPVAFDVPGSVEEGGAAMVPHSHIQGDPGRAHP
eukprot:12076939-Alexandrium_andersonii.AAC.1